MAVVTITAPEIIKLTGLKKEQILEGLANLGMPAEEAEGEISVEVTPNRPDFFSIEGMARALNCFYGKKPKEYSAKKSSLKVKIEPSVGKSRPYVVAAVVKNADMNENVLKSMIQLQEKLHETVGRKRKKLAIGIHNADKISFPLVYRFVKDARFAPLDFDEEMGIDEILGKHPKGRAYAHLVRNGYPMLYDQKGVISFPPIINCERTRVTETTKNLLIEMTGTHLGTLSGALNIVACALADRGGEIYEVVVDKTAYPKLGPVKMALRLEKINALLGENFDRKRILGYLERLGWAHDGKNSIFAPPYRLDVSDYADVTEDAAIAHGYNDFEPTMPDFFIPGKLAYTNDDLRQGMIGLGFLEVVNYALTNREKLDMSWKGEKPVGIINPKTEEFTLLRTNLAVSLLDNIAANKNYELPVKIFEIGRVYGGAEKIHLGFALSGEVLDFANIRGVLQSLSLIMEKDFVLKGSENGFFMNGRRADVYYKNSRIGAIGEVSPPVLGEFGIENPVGLCEIEISRV